MPELVAHHIGTLPGKDRPSRRRAMEELQALAVIKGVEIDPEIEIHREYGAHFPRKSRQQSAPEVGAAPQCFSRGPVTKLRSTGRMRLGLGGRGRMNNAYRQWLLAQNGDRSLDDLAAARLITGAGIVLPRVDYFLGLCPAFRGYRAYFASALAARGRPLRPALGSLLRHLISPVAASPTQHHRRDELALVAAWPFSPLLQ